jgi:beta-glucosidase/6-phospho-beta-glucosidase/beta-galactosidase
MSFLFDTCLSQDLYQGFLDPQVAADFTNYADIAFREFGPYVKHWLTFNEPMSICQLGYGIGVHAPGHEGAAKAQYR